MTRHNGADVAMARHNGADVAMARHNGADSKPYVCTVH